MSLNHWHIPTSEDEIVDVFVEEVGELLDGMDESMRAWAEDPGDRKALTEIRRTFHTLKGSGRTVKALDLSELSWKVESMLNQAMSGIVPPSRPMVELVAAVRAQIPKMVSAFKQGRSVAGSREIERLLKTAEDLAAGRKPSHSAPAESIGLREIRLSELDAKYERCMQRADEALHRSEMALQKARQSTIGCRAPQGGAGSPPACAELDRIGERVSSLAKEVTAGILESKNRRQEPFLNHRELNPIIERRLRSKMAPLELLRIEYERDIAANRRAIRRLRRVGWVALAISALLGGAIATGLQLALLSAT